MHEAPNLDFDQAKHALILARAYHAGAALAARHRPNDPDVQRRLQEATQQGKSAWKNYQGARMAGIALPSSDFVPSTFQEE